MGYRSGKHHRRRMLVGLLVTGVVIAGFLILFILLETGFENFYNELYPTDYAEYVDRYAERFDVPKSLVYAVIKTESSFRPDATSPVGARGLMQLMPDAFDWVHMRIEEDEVVSYDDMYDPERNIEYGTFMLSLLLSEFGSVETALSAYHAGWGSVKGWLGDDRYTENGVDLTAIPIAETRAYVEKVTETRQVYQSLYDFS